MAEVQVHGRGTALRCTSCGKQLYIYDSRTQASRGHVRRRRRCPNGHRVTTLEVVLEEDEAIVMRRRGGRVEQRRFWADGDLELGLVRPLELHRED